MSGFDKGWLALREPADIAARDRDVVRQLAATLSGDGAVIVDIGCGTGSTVRALRPLLAAQCSLTWRLVDYDAKLLDEARRQLGDTDISFHQVDLNTLDDLLLEGASVLSASAFFDLASAELCENIAAAVARQGCAFYAALNYDGVMQWKTAHPLDAAVVRDFNMHQRRDKGLGAALGPQAVAHLAGVFTSLGYAVSTAKSPWVLGEEEAELQQHLLDGMIAPVLEIGTLDRAALDAWLAFRLDRVHEFASCEVGHLDLLALPRL